MKYLMQVKNIYRWMKIYSIQIFQIVQQNGQLIVLIKFVVFLILFLRFFIQREKLKRDILRFNNVIGFNCY
ncbi:unnamed protein product [Paramecium pentaurelia]|uniref:Transmembrane protein n=1 Tax=Paramecium pentaurelia TaxID=43138 RepID=A0A8S1UET2_9CILI|nr:unnamed protein product [Paramecium pentaurelia]